MRVSATTREATKDRTCALIADEQAGLITLAQALAAGLTQSAIDWRLRTGRWRLVLPTVFCISGAPASTEQSLVAAQLWAGEGSAVSHRAAAFLWGFKGFKSPPLEISTVKAKRPNGLPLIVHRVDDLLLPEIVDGTLPVTSVRRTLFDIAGLDHPRLESSLDQALREELVTIGQCWLFLDNPEMWGRRGVRRLRDLLAVRTPGQAPSDSDLELLGIRVLVEGGLPRPAQQFPIELPDGLVIHADLAYPEATLAIECDSYGYHMDREAFERDRLRDLGTRRVGWETLRFTWAMFKWQPEYVVETVRWHRDRRLPS